MEVPLPDVEELVNVIRHRICGCAVASQDLSGIAYPVVALPDGDALSRGPQDLLRLGYELDVLDGGQYPYSVAQ